MSLSSELKVARDEGWYATMESAAQQFHLPLAYVLAIASRETNMRNVIGADGGGVGVFQIDARFHQIARDALHSGSWQTNPTPLIEFGIHLLASNHVWAQGHFPQFGGAEGRGWLKIAASAYNAGQGGAADGIERGDSDTFTTGRDYGADVLDRMDQFSNLL